MLNSFSRKICAGIVTYNPDVSLLSACLFSIRYQVGYVVIVDNASKNIREIHDLCSKESIKLIENNRNLGIAAALNQIASEARKQKCEWFLSLDQDSVCNKDMIEKYYSPSLDPKVGLLCPQIIFRKSQNIDVVQNVDVKEVDVAITSGSLVKVEAWVSINGFWNYLFIDKVDEDFCYSLNEFGWKIVKVFKVALEHEIGTPRKHSFFYLTYYTDSYPAFRYYYIARNSIIISHVHKRVNYRLTSSLTKRFLKILLGENCKYKKLKCFFRGVRDGIELVYKGIERTRVIL